MKNKIKLILLANILAVSAYALVLEGKRPVTSEEDDETPGACEVIPAGGIGNPKPFAQCKTVTRCEQQRVTSVTCLEGSANQRCNNSPTIETLAYGECSWGWIPGFNCECRF